MSHRLLIDNNLSHNLAEPCWFWVSMHSTLSPPGFRKQTILKGYYAKNNNFHILTKDSDISHSVALRGFSPKVIQLDVSNRSIRAIVELLESNVAGMKAFLDDDKSGLLVLI